MVWDVSVGLLRSLPSSKNKRGERNFICQSHVIGEQIDISKAGQRNSNEKATCSTWQMTRRHLAQSVLLTNLQDEI